MSVNKKQKHKKQEEFHYLEAFLKIAKIEAEFIERDRESPDFIIRCNGLTCGVEVTKVFISNEKGSQTLQARESRAAKIITKAQKLYESFAEPPVNVKIIIHPELSLTEISIDETAYALASFVRGFKIKEGESIEWKPEDSISPLPNEISYVRIHRIAGVNLMHWGVAAAGWVSSISASILQDRIDAKAKLLPYYTKEVDQHWLLLVANRTKPSQMLQMPNTSLGIQSPFSRTFFYPYPENNFLEF